MKKIALFAIKSVFPKLDPLRKDNSFEVFIFISYLDLTL